MKIRLPHAPYIARKIAIDLLNSGYVTFTEGVDIVAERAEEILEEDLKKELALEERVNEILEENEDEMEFMRVDRRNMFWLVKKKMAADYGVILSYEDRFNNVAHLILDKLYDDDLINYSVSENIIKNVIYTSIENYIESFERIEDDVIEKIEKMQRKLIPGSDDYNVVFERLYRDELRKKGML
ncbi:MAG: DUF507 domain-containing protein [Sulfurospirillum sp.]|nr:MAG: DUF507 domain-containing protein [Sulfurospirillum sp.]